MPPAKNLHGSGERESNIQALIDQLKKGHTVQVCSQTPQNVQSVAQSDDPFKLMVQRLKEGHTIQIRPPGHHSGECSGGIEGANRAAVPSTRPTYPPTIHTQLPVPKLFQGEGQKPPDSGKGNVR